MSANFMDFFFVFLEKGNPLLSGFFFPVKKNKARFLLFTFKICILRLPCTADAVKNKIKCMTHV